MERLISIRSVPENVDYLLVDVKVGITSITMYDLEVEAYKEMQMMYFKLCEYEENSHSHSSDDIALKKDSIVGRFLLSHPELCINQDEVVTYKKVVDAYNVAVFEDNKIMEKKILPYFKNKICGDRWSLQTKENGDVLDYILKNGNFEKYLDALDDKIQNKEYLVYEDGEYTRKTLGPNFRVVKQKNHNNS